MRLKGKSVFFDDETGGVRVEANDQFEQVGRAFVFAPSGDVELTGIASITGSNFDDVILGTSANNKIAGLDGNDILSGFSGADKIIDGPGDDRVHGGFGNDKITLGRGADTLDLGSLLDFGSVSDPQANGGQDKVKGFVQGEDKLAWSFKVFDFDQPLLDLGTADFFAALDTTGDGKLDAADDNISGGKKGLVLAYNVPADVPDFGGFVDVGATVQIAGVTELTAADFTA